MFFRPKSWNGFPAVAWLVAKESSTCRPCLYSFMKLVQRVRQSNDSNLLSALKTLVFVSVFYGFLGQMRFALPNSLTCRAWVMRVFGWWYIYFWVYPSPTDSEVVSWSFTIMPGIPEPCLWLWTNTTNSSGSFKLMNENNRTQKDATVGQREWKVYNFNPLHTGLQKQIHRKRKDNQRNSANVLLCFVSTCWRCSLHTKRYLVFLVC